MEEIKGANRDVVVIDINTRRVIANDIEYVSSNEILVSIVIIFDVATVNIIANVYANRNTIVSANSAVYANANAVPHANTNIDANAP